jgi:hypothetical protein
LTKLYDISSNTFITMYAIKISIAGNPISIISRSLIVTGSFLYLTTLLGFIAIFLYKNRKLQMLITSIAMVCSFFCCNFIVITSYRIMPSADTSLSFTLYALFPVIALILFYMAYKAINKDDKLVKSIDRIR